MICQVDKDGFCLRHQCKHVGRQLELALDPGEKGEAYRNYWDQEVGLTESYVPRSGPEHLLLRTDQCPGDILVMSAAIHCLMKQYPGKYKISVSSCCNWIFDNNPYVVKTSRNAKKIIMHYPAVHESDARIVHYIQGYIEYLSKTLDIPIKCSVNRPYLYISEQERNGHDFDLPNQYVVLNAGYKNDYVIKWWGKRYQELVDHYEGKLTFVQVGQKHHNHPALNGVINLVGKTERRKIISLCYHSMMGIGGESFLRHVYAAFQKPHVTIASGFNPKTWSIYNTEIYLTKQGLLSCCQFGGCWKSRVVPFNDGQDHPSRMCQKVVNYGGENLPKCMQMISLDEVIMAIDSYIDGGVVKCKNYQ